MKKFQAEYSENSITYWPTYEAGKIGIIALMVLGTLFIATSIWVLLDNPSKETALETVVAFPLVVLVLYFATRYLTRMMYSKIVVSTEGIVCFKGSVASKKQISWSEVSAVYFHQDPWYGRQSCRIFFKKDQFQESCEKDRPDFVLPISSVDEQKLQQLIPAYLWNNNPHWI